MCSQGLHMSSVWTGVVSSKNIPHISGGIYVIINKMEIHRYKLWEVITETRVQ